MTKTPSDPNSRPVPLADRAEILERLYDVAVDPIRMEELLDAWEGRMGPMRDLGDNQLRIEDAEIEAHLDRARVFLDRFETMQDNALYRSVLDGIPRSAAFLCDAGREIVAFNRAAGVAFSLAAGATLADLPFDGADQENLQAALRQISIGSTDAATSVLPPRSDPAAPVVLRLRSQITQSPVILRLGRIEGEAGEVLVLVVSTELVWPEGFEVLVQGTFGLTSAEIEIVRGITLGLPIKTIAEARGRSTETVRTQLRSILQKTETHSQAELVRVVLGLMDVAHLPQDGGGRTARRALADLPFKQAKGAGGRRLDFIEFGDPAGRPVLYMPIDYMLIRWTASAERAAAARGLRVIVPVRAGYGQSAPHPRRVHYGRATAEDYAAVLDHLGIAEVTVLSIGADLEYALRLAALRPGLVRGVVATAARLPTLFPAQYQRMDKWHRFILANARHAPRLLPYLVHAGFAYSRRIGKVKFLEAVNAGSPADLECFARPEVREAMLLGSEVCLSDRYSAHEAFSREVIQSEQAWEDVVRQTRVKVICLQGDQDPQSPVETMREMAEAFPHLDIRFWAGTGQLLFFAEWPRVLEVLEEVLPPLGPEHGTGNGAGRGAATGR